MPILAVAVYSESKQAAASLERRKRMCMMIEPRTIGLIRVDCTDHSQNTGYMSMR
ncbi:MAG: hypothetical protein OXC03_06385 [Flavobacteriaceae bacterium]|nr:hypothetical protein [Flavobacteriaceae bacterium]